MPINFYLYAMQWILPVIYTFIFILLINKWKFFAIDGISKKAVAAVFILKIIAGTTAWFVFSRYYASGDILSYFQDGNTLFYILLNDPGRFFNIVFAGAPCTELLIWNGPYEAAGYNTARTMSLLNMIFRFFSFGNFHVHTVILNFLSLTGLVAIYKTFSGYIVSYKKIFFFAVFLIPSVLFWGSSVLKEGFLMFVSGMLIYLSGAGLRTKYSWKDIALIFLFVILHLLIKLYVLIALLPGFIVNAWIARDSSKQLVPKYLLVLSVSFVMLAGFAMISHRLDVPGMLADKQTTAIREARGGVYLYNDQKVVCIDYEKQEEQLEWLKDSSCRIKKGSDYIFWYQHNMSHPYSVKNSDDTSVFFLAYTIKGANSVTDVPELKPTMISMVKNIPAAIWHSLSAPSIWNLKKRMYILPAIENLLFMGMVLFTLMFAGRSGDKKPMVLFCLSFGLILLFFAGISAPAAGTLIRYKVPALLFLAIAFVLVLENSWINKPGKADDI